MQCTLTMTTGSSSHASACPCMGKLQLNKGDEKRKKIKKGNLGWDRTQGGGGFESGRESHTSTLECSGASISPHSQGEFSKKTCTKMVYSNHIVIQLCVNVPKRNKKYFQSSMFMFMFIVRVHVHVHVLVLVTRSCICVQHVHAELACSLDMKLVTANVNIYFTGSS
jgi:hypothetical protein